MWQYQRQLQRLVEVAGDGKSYRQGNDQLNFRLREGQVYAFKTPDNPNYFKTVFLKKLGQDQVLKAMVSEVPVYGDIPDHIQEIQPEQIYQYLRLHNMSSMNAFPAFNQGITKGDQK